MFLGNNFIVGIKLILNVLGFLEWDDYVIKLLDRISLINLPFVLKNNRPVTNGRQGGLALPGTFMSSPWKNLAISTHTAIGTEF